MTLNYRRKKRSVSGTLLVTFILGIGIGFTLCFALMEMIREDDAASRERMQEAARPAEPVPAPAVPPVSPTPAAPSGPTAEPAPPALVESWPARHLFVGVPGVQLDASARALLETFAPSGVVVRTENVESADQLRAMAGDIRIVATPDQPGAAGPLIATFMAGGAINPLKIEEAPPPREIAALEGIDAVRELGARMGQACRARGIDLVFGPPLDIFRPGVSEPSLESMTFANDDMKVTAVGLALAAGLIEGGVLAIPSHYPGEGSAVSDASGVRVIQEHDLAALETMIRPFDAAAQQEMPGLLVGHVAVPALEGDGPLIPAAFSEKLVRMFLRDMRTFKGVLFSGDISGTAPLAGRSIEQAAVDTLAAGCDAVLLLDTDAARLTSVCDAIATATREGKLSKEDLDASFSRLNELRARIQPAPIEESRIEASAQPLSPGESAPPDDRMHPVKAGETLSSIALQHGVSVSDLEQWNDLGNSAIIKLGQELRIRAPEPVPETIMPEPAPPPSEPAPAATPDAEAPATTEETAQDAEDPMASETVETATPESQPPVAPAEEPEPPHAPEPPDEEPPPDLPPGTAPPNTEHRVYRIAPGDTLSSVANQYGVKIEEIRRWNGLGSDRLNPGGQLDIYLPIATENAPAGTSEFDYYRVAEGDTLHNIALRHNTTVPDLLKYNKFPNPNVLLKGQRIKIPKSP